MHFSNIELNDMVLMSGRYCAGPMRLLEDHEIVAMQGGGRKGLKDFSVK